MRNMRLQRSARLTKLFIVFEHFPGNRRQVRGVPSEKKAGSGATPPVLAHRRLTSGSAIKFSEPDDQSVPVQLCLTSHEAVTEVHTAASQTSQTFLLDSTRKSVGFRAILIELNHLDRNVAGECPNFRITPRSLNTATALLIKCISWYISSNLQNVSSCTENSI